MNELQKYKWLTAVPIHFPQTIVRKSPEENQKLRQNTSYYARHRRLSEETLYAYTRYNDNLRDRLYFYYNFFQDVVPDGVTVHYVPSMLSGNTRQGLELRTHTGRIFMYGLVSMEHNTSQIARVAAEEAYTKFREGYYTRDDGAWRSFTCLTQVRMYACFDGSGRGEFQGLLHPISDVRETAVYLQNQYDSMAHY